MGYGKHYDRWKAKEGRRRWRERQKGNPVPPATGGRGPGIHTQRFLAVDGEGGNINGRHEYTLLVAAGKNYQNNVHNGGLPLTASQCLDFILGLPQRRKLIAFYFNYDIAMILRELDAETLAYLIDRDARTTYSGKTIPCEWGEYALDWIPGKIFKVSRGRESRVIYDTAGFFQSSLVAALDGWRVGDDNERAFIEAMKSQRSEFTGEVSPQVIAYAETECRLLCKLMDLVYRESTQLGFHLRTFSGAGSLANAMLLKWGVGDMVGTLPDPVSDAAWHGYFGGRFETAAVGEIPGPIYEYDINSAYPYAMQDLPCLSCGEWSHDESGAYIPGLTISRVIWDIPRGERVPTLNAHWGPFPWRDGSHGTICYPFAGQGWYWSPEVRAGLDGPFGEYIQIAESWTYTTECEHKPFGNVPTLYEHRRVLKAAGHLGERVIKLGINSLYGKTAQTVGNRRFASPVWAGMITSTARAMCYRAMISPEGHGETYGATPNVLMVATDAVYSRVPLDCLDLGDGLGQWEMQRHDNMLIVQPGLYALNVDTALAEIRKTRGIRKTSFGATDVLGVWRTDGMQGAFDVPVTSFVGLRRGLISTQHNAGDWIEETRRISFWPRSKRIPIPIVRDGATYMQSIPSDGETPMSARYTPKPLTEELRAHIDRTADDTATPTPEGNPSRIPGFKRADET